MRVSGVIDGVTCLRTRKRAGSGVGISVFLLCRSGVAGELVAGPGEGICPRQYGCDGGFIISVC